MLDGLLGRRERALEPEVDGLLHLRACRLGDLVRLLSGERPVGDEARAEAIEALWPEDESEETEALRQEKLADLYRELREDLAEVLGGER